MSIVFFGNTQAGIQLLHLMQKFSKEEATNITLNLSAAYFAKTSELEISIVNNDPRFQALRNLYYRSESTGVYCIDLLAPSIEMANEIKEFQHLSHFSNVILVGINNELSAAEGKEKLQSIREELQENGFYIPAGYTISGEDDGLYELITALQCITQRNAFLAKRKEERDRPLSPWEMAVSSLKRQIQELPYAKFTAITEEIDNLKWKLEQSVDITVKEKAIQTFSQNCHNILERKHQHVLNVVLTLAAVATVTIVVGLIGFGLGFAAGLWTGPGAFISGILTGAAFAKGTLAVSGTLGLISGGLVGYGLFKSSKEVVAIHDFAEQVKMSVM
ncbi:hypothetical protein [Legionella clemsonensis]|uniref:Uncharacterized protein n=1 Tax=Legionella clemsonensis TaxID=1867846 RepID=A0A222P2U7_9GAMM|nr:hypothetical protein [Legionella clemsonensis]ASQ46151.1 hypothetical protein clem_07995 [Legionella clemsonensis]